LLNELLDVGDDFREVSDLLVEPLLANVVSFLDDNWDKLFDFLVEFLWCWLNLGSGTL